jgi:hypothetical protein
VPVCLLPFLSSWLESPSTRCCRHCKPPCAVLCPTNLSHVSAGVLIAFDIVSLSPLPERRLVACARFSLVLGGTKRAAAEAVQPSQYIQLSHTTVAVRTPRPLGLPQHITMQYSLLPLCSACPFPSPTVSGIGSCARQAFVPFRPSSSLIVRALVAASSSQSNNSKP